MLHLAAVLELCCLLAVPHMDVILVEHSHSKKFQKKAKLFPFCGLVVRVPGYRSRGPGFDFRRYQNF
jgi:hypothetical protein